MTVPQPIYPSIPEYITVHIGRPDSGGKNLQVPFKHYIKNVASSEIYPTWPDAALRANIYAQISFALNRIYTEWYRSKGYDFDITNSTQFDQAFSEGRDIFGNINNIVDEIFNDYVVRDGKIEPYFTEFCNGTTAKCPGLSQWGTVDLANKGYTPYEILKYYYGDDINIVFNAPVENVDQSYAGIPLELGSVGNDVKTLQIQLNRIGKNYPAITRIAQTNGVFGVDTKSAVRIFQSVFNMPLTGVVDKATWYQIKNIYNSVKKIAELSSEGISAAEVTPLYPSELSYGMVGSQMYLLQYYLNVFAYFSRSIPAVQQTGVFDTATLAAVKAFQRQYGLPVTGVIYRATWKKILQIYKDILSSLEPSVLGGKAELYPGYFLTVGMENDDVRNLQKYLQAAATVYPNIAPPSITGYYGDQTEAAVKEIQRIFGLPVTGNVGAVTWYRIAMTYDELQSFN